MLFDQTVIGLTQFLDLPAEGETRRTVVNHVFHVGYHRPQLLYFPFETEDVGWTVDCVMVSFVLPLGTLVLLLNQDLQRVLQLLVFFYQFLELSRKVIFIDLRRPSVYGSYLLLQSDYFLIFVLEERFSLFESFLAVPQLNFKEIDLSLFPLEQLVGLLLNTLHLLQDASLEGFVVVAERFLLACYSGRGRQLVFVEVGGLRVPGFHCLEALLVGKVELVVSQVVDGLRRHCRDVFTVVIQTFPGFGHRLALVLIFITNQKESLPAPSLSPPAGVIIILKLMSQYGRAEYWEERYSRDPGLFDWYQRYFALRELVGANIPIEFRVLNVGSGNSRMSEEMFEDGYETITNIDISQTSIKAMNELYKDKGPNFKYIQMDVRAMEFAQNSFDAVIDKGTFDSVVCGEGSNTNASKMLTEIYKVLGPNGLYFLISFAGPETRLDHLKRKEFEWGIWVHKIQRPTVAAQITPANTEKEEKNFHYVYICIKGKKNEEGPVIVQQKKEEKK